MISEHDPAHHYRAKMNPEFVRRARIKQREREQAERLAEEAEKRRLFALNYAAAAQAKLAQRAAAAEAKRAAKEAAKAATETLKEEARKAALAMKATQAYRIIIVNQASEEKQPARCIIERVSAVFGIPYREIMGVSRTREVVAARQAAMYEVRKLRPDLSLPQIGKIFGGRDHTTVLHAVRKIQAQRAGEPR